MLMEMISTLLDVGKMEAGKMKLDFSAVDISDLAGETIRMLEPITEMEFPLNIVRRYLINSARWRRTNRVGAIRPVSA
jgi:signal transduction histidine kinase